MNIDICFDILVSEFFVKICHQQFCRRINKKSSIKFWSKSHKKFIDFFYQKSDEKLSQSFDRNLVKKFEELVMKIS